MGRRLANARGWGFSSANGARPVRGAVTGLAAPAAGPSGRAAPDPGRSGSRQNHQCTRDSEPCEEAGP